MNLPSLRPAGAALILAAAFSPPADAEPTSLSVYFIGNSITDQLNYDELAALAASRGHDHTWGRHSIPGAPLNWIWENPDQGFTQAPYGSYDTALPDFEWDAVTLQPFDRLIEGSWGDRIMAGNFIDLTLSNPANADTTFYLFQRWPRRQPISDETGQTVDYQPLDYAGRWDAPYDPENGLSIKTRDFFEQLHAALVEDHPEIEQNIMMIPTGDVLYELNERIEAEQIPTLDSLEQLYVDAAHFTDVGRYVVGLTVYATLYQQDPTNLPGQPYSLDDEQLIAALQGTVWDVVSTHPYAIPEPGTLGLIALGGALLLGGRRRRGGRT